MREAFLNIEMYPLAGIIVSLAIWHGALPPSAISSKTQFETLTSCDVGLWSSMN